MTGLGAALREDVSNLVAVAQQGSAAGACTALTDHIRVGKVENAEVVVLELFDHLVHDLWSTHLRLQVIGSNFRRWHDVAVLSFVMPSEVTRSNVCWDACGTW